MPLSAQITYYGAITYTHHANFFFFKIHKYFFKELYKIYIFIYLIYIKLNTNKKIN